MFFTSAILEFQKPKPPVQSDSIEEVRRAKKRRRTVGDVIKEYESQNKHFMGKYVLYFYLHYNIRFFKFYCHKKLHKKYH